MALKRQWYMRSSSRLLFYFGLTTGALNFGKAAYGSSVMAKTIVHLNHAKTIVHLNHAGASPSASSVLETVIQHQREEQRLGGYQAAAHAQERLQAVYDKAAHLIHAAPNEIALVESATVAWTRLFYSMCAAQQQVKTSTTKKIILISEAEYAANVVAACQWARTSQGEWTVLTIPSTGTKSTGKVNLEIVKQMLQGTYRCSNGNLLDPSSIALVCLTHVPTNSGIVNPAMELGELIQNFNEQQQRQQEKNSGGKSFPSILHLLDSCQSIGQLPVFVDEIQCHGLVGTGRKYLRGPRGTGFLYIQNSLLTDHDIMPHHVDHFGLPVQQVPSRLDLHRPVEEFLSIAPLPTAKRFEFWESNVAGRLGLGEAIQEVLDIGVEQIQKDIYQRARKLYQGLLNIPFVAPYYPPECGICTFALKDTTLDPIWVKEQLWKETHIDDGVYSFEVSVVPTTSTPLDCARREAPTLLRASVSYSTTSKEIGLFCKRLASILEHGTKMS